MPAPESVAEQAPQHSGASGIAGPLVDERFRATHAWVQLPRPANESAMLVLGIETASPRGSVALVSGGEVLVELSHESPNAHAEQIVRLIDEAFERTKLGKRDLDRVGVGVGPGSFTGLRVGIALAQGIALGLDAPVVAVPSLQAMSHEAAKAAPGKDLYGALLDARRQEAFFAAYDVDGTERLPVKTLPVASLASELTNLLGPSAPSVAICGRFAQQFGSQLSEAGLTVVGHAAGLPSAVATAELAARATDTNLPVVPLYVREPDAILPNLPPNPLAS